MTLYKCMFCKHIYDEQKGNPPSGIAPGTAWEDVPHDWTCPNCHQSKSAFRKMVSTKAA